MIKNKAGQKIQLYAYDYSTGAPKTGDAANLTFYVAKDGGAVTALTDTSASEMQATNAPGWYECDVTATESNFDDALFSGKSSTANVVVVGRMVSTAPTYLAEMIARFLSMVEAASGSPNEFRFTADALVRTTTVIGMGSGNLDAQLSNLSGRLPAALVSGRIDASVGAVASGAIGSAAFSTTAGSFNALGIVDQGTAQAATATTLQLRAAAAFASSELIGAVIVITGGTTGVGQSRVITAYNGATDTATVDAWTTTPSGTITYQVLAAPPADSTATAIKAVTDKLNTTLESAPGSPGEYRFATDALVNAPSGTMTAAGIRAAVGLASANLDTQLSTIDDFLDTEVAAIKVTTDQLSTMFEPAVGSPGEYRYSADALRKAPTGSGGGGGGGPSAAEIALAVWDESLPGAYGAGKAGKLVGDNLNATIGSRATQTSVDTLAGYVDTEVSAIKAKTDNLPAAPAATGDIPTATQNADALLNRDMSAVSDTNARSPLNALRFIRNKWSISGGTLTVTKENDSTTAWTAAVSTTAGADPVTGNDPA